jgi:hypothetical protein
LITTVIHFLADLQQNFAPFKDFSFTSTFTKDFLKIFYPLICNAEHLSAETELDLTLAEDAQQKLREETPLTGLLTKQLDDGMLIKGTNSSLEVSHPNLPEQRDSSFVLVESDTGSAIKMGGHIITPLVPYISGFPHRLTPQPRYTGEIGSSLIDFLVDSFTSMVLERRDFSGFGLLTKV